LGVSGGVGRVGRNMVQGFHWVKGGCETKGGEAGRPDPAARERSPAAEPLIGRAPTQRRGRLSRFPERRRTGHAAKQQQDAELPGFPGWPTGVGGSREGSRSIWNRVNTNRRGWKTAVNWRRRAIAVVLHSSLTPPWVSGTFFLFFVDIMRSASRLLLRVKG
jgi:hypothetical protein